MFVTIFPVSTLTPNDSARALKEFDTASKPPSAANTKTESWGRAGQHEQLACHQSTRDSKNNYMGITYLQPLDSQDEVQ
jgi:hypothetical protein